MTYYVYAGFAYVFFNSETAAFDWYNQMIEYGHSYVEVGYKKHGDKYETMLNAYTK